MKIRFYILCLFILPSVSLAYDLILDSVEEVSMNALYNNTCNQDCTWSKNGNVDPCSWSGVLCIAEGDTLYIQLLHLQSMGLTGSLPPEIGNFTRLFELNIEYNSLSGLIPDEIGNLIELTGIWASANQLSGPLPASIGNLSKLWFVELCDNNLSGSLPTEIGNLVGVRRLWLCQNQFEGIIPASIQNIPNLELLALSDNNWSCPIPDYSSWASISADYSEGIPCVNKLPLNGIYKGGVYKSEGLL